ncbi:MAG TPA: flavocytochrome c, partial [Terriglobales bacterium]|nr:flavocytochrome c [Terriglobales bacterium]
PEPEPEPTPEPEPAGTEYTAKSQGFGGDVVVTVTYVDGAMTKVQAWGDKETAGIGSKAIEELPAKILAAKSAAVDGVAGATVTSGAVKAAATAAIAEATGTAVAPSGMKAGTYQAGYRGYTSEVVTAVTVDAEKILKVEVLSQAETVGIGSYALNQMPADFVKYQTVNVDTVAGATATSMAIKSGVIDALRQAGADLDDFAAAPPAATPTDVALEADVVVIGAGAAGLTAGVNALENGASSVIVVEKMDLPGGNTIRSSGSWNVSGHPTQIANNAARANIETFIATTMEGGHYTNDEALVRYMIEKSAFITDWMTEIGFAVSFGEGYGGASVPGVARGLIIGLQEKFEARGGKLMLATKATQITTDTAGAASGIVCTGADGGTVTVKAGAVVVATGGYGYNLEMCVALDPNLKGFVTNNHPGAMGEGITMATAIGAATVDLNEIQTHPTVHQATANMLTEGCRTAGSLLINQSGKRFTNECGFRDVVSEAILAQEGKYAYLLMNEAIVNSNVNIASYVPLGTLIPVGDLDGAAAFMKVDPAVLKNTVETWNGYVANKLDPEFGSKFAWYRDLSEGPYYVSQIAPGIHHTMGGLKINTSTEVLKADGTALPGLFACGEVTGGVHGGNRVGGNAILDCLVFGYTAGASAAAYAAK